MRIVLVFFVLFSITVDAQTDRSLSLRYSHGFFMPHRESLPQLLQGHANCLELSYRASVDGSQDWHHHFSGPYKGIGLYVQDMGNDRELGDIISLYPFLGLPLNKSQENRIILHMGIGLAYLTRTYHPDDNFLNPAIGSHLNYSILMALRYERVMDRFLMGAGLSMTHASNAALSLPNLGVNVVALDFTLAYRLNTVSNSFDIERNIEWQKDKVWSVQGAVGLRDASSATKNRYGVQELKLIYRTRFSPKLSFTLGADLIHNRATYLDIEEVSILEWQSLQKGLCVGLAMHFGKGLLYFSNGFYLDKGFQDQGSVYHRAGGRTMLGEQIYIDLGLKTHFAKADYLSLGIGYLLSKRTTD